mmetsp:Transcript_20830/g.67458  ORF Transcript_20830/g.67458 Transcript_20830/m.67458 type:complete len:168 (-) Transcript_20830:199-702(-)
MAVPYIGATLSLITKSDIRYEGVLVNLDTDTKTLHLQNVRSFGTEGRKKDGPQIMPSSETYGYIEFPGDQVKALDVQSQPQVEPTPPPPQPMLVPPQPMFGYAPQPGMYMMPQMPVMPPPAPPAPAPAAPATLPAGWFAAADPATGNTYYYTAGGAVQWEVPTTPAA